jgi:hypothetical protein
MKLHGSWVAPVRCIVCCNLLCSKNILIRNWSATFKSEKRINACTVREVLSNVKMEETMLLLMKGPSVQQPQRLIEEMIVY